MEIQVKEIDKCNLKIKYIADASEINAKKAEIVKLFKKAPVPGSRDGKASDQALQIHYRQQINDALKRALSENAFHNTIFEKKLRPHGAPRFNSSALLEGYFSCEFDLFVKPDFELSPIENLEIVKPHSTLNEVEETQRTLQELRERMGEATPYSEEDTVAMGDSVLVSFEGTIDGEKIPHLCGENEMITVGKTDLATFDENLIGMKMGEKKEFDFVAPDTGLASLANKVVHFNVEIMTGSKSTPCPLDDSLAQKVGKENFAELQTFVKGLAATKVQNHEKLLLNEAISKKLCEMNTIDVPNWMTLQEARYLASSAKLQFETLPKEDQDQYLKFAENNVKTSLILDRIREQEPEAQITDQEVFETIKHGIMKTHAPEQVNQTMEDMQKTGYFQVLFARVKDQHTYGWLESKTKIVE